MLILLDINHFSRLVGRAERSKYLAELSATTPQDTASRGTARIPGAGRRFTSVGLLSPVSCLLAVGAQGISRRPWLVFSSHLDRQGDGHECATAGVGGGQGTPVLLHDGVGHIESHSHVDPRPLGEMKIEQ